MNGVPLRRVNQAYVIATKTKVDIGTLTIPAKLDDNYFRRSSTKTKVGSSGIFAESKQVSLLLGVTLTVWSCFLMCRAIPLVIYEKRTREPWTSNYCH